MALIGDAYQEDIEDIFMEDVDGSGFSLTIPALYIHGEAFDRIDESFDDDERPKLRAHLEISERDAKVADVSLWYGSTLDLPKKLIEELYDYGSVLKNFVRFTPHVITLQCPNCVLNVQQKKECLADGLYCLAPPKADVHAKYNVTNGALLAETLYGRCLQEIIQVEDHDLFTWFNYMYNVRKVCFKTEFMGFKTNETIGVNEIVHCAKD